MTPKQIALKEQIETGTLKNAMAKILNIIITHKKVTIQNIIYWTGIKESTVVARLSDLEDLGMIIRNGVTDDKKHSYWSYVKNNEQWDSFAKIRQKQKFLSWKKRGLLLYSNLMSDTLKSELEAPVLSKFDSTNLIVVGKNIDLD